MIQLFLAYWFGLDFKTRIDLNLVWFYVHMSGKTIKTGEPTFINILFNILNIMKDSTSTGIPPSTFQNVLYYAYDLTIYVQRKTFTK